MDGSSRRVASGGLCVWWSGGFKSRDEHVAGGGRDEGETTHLILHGKQARGPVLLRRRLVVILARQVGIGLRVRLKKGRGLHYARIGIVRERRKDEDDINNAKNTYNGMDGQHGEMSDGEGEREREKERANGERMVD